MSILAEATALAQNTVGTGTAPFTAPHVEFGKLSPMLIVLGAATAGVLVEAFVPRAGRYRTQVALTLASLAAAFAAVVSLHNAPTQLVAQGAVAIDKTTLFLQGTILVIAFIG